MLITIITVVVGIIVIAILNNKRRKYKGMYKNEVKTNNVFNTQLNQSKTKVTKLEGAIINLEGQNGNLKGNIKSLETKVANLKDEVNVLNTEKETLEAAVINLKKSLADKSNILTDANKEYKKLFDESMHLRAKISDLETVNKDLAKFIAGTEPKCEDDGDKTCCEGEICNETPEVEVSISETETEPKIVVVAEEAKPEVKLSKSQLKKLNRKK